MTPAPDVTHAITDAPPRCEVAVLIPCFNEAGTIAAVVADFRSTLPHARIHVFDNNSTDSTAEIAHAAGARVHRTTLQGKGHVVRRMFADVDADIYLLVDGDGTYDAASAPGMVERLMRSGLDMVNGARVHGDASAYRRGHVAGNRFLAGLVASLFGDRLSDLLSGYRAFSRRFVKSFPGFSSGFEIETELTVHALRLSMPVGEVPTPYGARPAGSASKLRTYQDGARILRTIMLLVEQERPLAFFSVIGVALLAMALGLASPIVVHFVMTGKVPRLPTAVLSTGLVLLACLSFVCGLILQSVARGRMEQRHLAYLALPGPPHAPPTNT